MRALHLGIAGRIIIGVFFLLSSSFPCYFSPRSGCPRTLICCMSASVTPYKNFGKTCFLWVQLTYPPESGLPIFRGWGEVAIDVFLHTWAEIFPLLLMWGRATLSSMRRWEARIPIGASRNCLNTCGRNWNWFWMMFKNNQWMDDPAPAINRFFIEIVWYQNRVGQIRTPSQIS